MRCRSACDLFADTGPGSGIIARLTPLTTFRVYDQLPSGWSRVSIEGGPFGTRVGLIRSDNLVLVSSGPIALPDRGPVLPSPSPITGPFVPGGDLDVDRPTIPSPVQPLPTPPTPPDTNAPPVDASSDGAQAAPPYTRVSPLAEIVVLSSPIWGAMLLSWLLPRSP